MRQRMKLLGLVMPMLVAVGPDKEQYVRHAHT